MVLVYRHQIYTDITPQSGRTADCVRRLTDQWAAWDAVNCDILLHKVSLIEMARDHLWLDIKGSSYVSDITLTELLSSSSLSGEKRDCVQSNVPWRHEWTRREVRIWITTGVQLQTEIIYEMTVKHDDDDANFFWFRFSYLDVSLTGTLSRSVADRKSALK